MEMSEEIYANTAVAAWNKSQVEEGIHKKNGMKLKTLTEKHNQEPTNSAPLGLNTAWSRWSKPTAASLLLLCVLLLVAVTVLWVKYNNLTTEINQLQTRHSNLTIENNQLQTSYNNLTTEINQLQTSYNNLTIENNQLQTSYNNLTTEINQLQTSYNNLTTQINQLQTSYNNLTIQNSWLQTIYNHLTIKYNQLLRSYHMLTNERNILQNNYNNVMSEKNNLLQERSALFKALYSLGLNYGSSLYTITTELRSWKETRQDCVRRGADLVIINSIGEQEFISKYFGRTEVWIGLNDTEKEGQFKWVDGSDLNTNFWAVGEPNNFQVEEDCAVIGPKNPIPNNWVDYSCDVTLVGICEMIFKF